MNFPATYKALGMSYLVQALLKEDLDNAFENWKGDFQQNPSGDFLADLNKSYEYLRTAVQNNPQDATLHISLGINRALAGNKDLVLQHLDLAWRISPSNFKYDLTRDVQQTGLIVEGLRSFIKNPTYFMQTFNF
ncbi:MAG: hypothetical protein SFU25_12130 [Candidatus Caenarcaniphilales bacterium]|nr:hypothetical protein [Candidatus Caenarcaniphilales bacterium]